MKPSEKDIKRMLALNQQLSGSAMSVDDYLQAEFVLCNNNQPPKEPPLIVSYCINWDQVRSNALSSMIQQMNITDWDKVSRMSSDDVEKQMASIIQVAVFTGFHLENTIALLQTDHNANVSASMAKCIKKRKKNE